MAKPFIKGYKDDEELQDHIKKLKTKDVSKDDIYVISHDDERTKRIAKNADASIIGAGEMGVTDAVKGTFTKKGDKLRNQLESIGFSESEAEDYEAEMDKGTVFLIVANTDNVDDMLV